MSSNWDKGTNSVRFLLPVHPVRALWAATQGRLQDLRRQEGHRYFHGDERHSSQMRDGLLGLGLGFVRFARFAIRERERERSENLGVLGF